MLLLLLLAAAAAWALYTLFTNRSGPLSALPGPSAGNPLLGHLLTIMNTSWGDEGKLFEPQLSWVRQFGDEGLVRYNTVLWTPKVIVTDPALLKYVLVTNVRNFVKPRQLSKSLKRTVGEGLLTSEGEVHQRQRRIITPAFHFENLRAIAAVIDAYAVQLVERWTRLAASGAPIDARPELSRFTLDVIGETAFSFKFNSLNEAKSEVADAYGALLPKMSVASFLKMVPGFSKLPLEMNEKERDARRLVRQTVQTIIEARVSSSPSSPSSPSSSADASDLLGIMMASRDEGSLSQSELVDQMLTFLVAGHETTSTALSWSLFLLAQHPEAVRRVRQEIAEAGVGQQGAPITTEDVKRLPYLTAVIKEVMRLYPSAPMTTREAVADDEFVGSNGKRTAIPKGTPVFIMPGVMGRLETLWSNPESFLPDRFVEGSRQAAADKEVRGGKTNPFAYLPFLAGERNCVGRNFAMLELQITLARLLSRLDFALAEGSKVRPTLKITMQAQGLSLMATPI